MSQFADYIFDAEKRVVSTSDELIAMLDRIAVNLHAQAQAKRMSRLAIGTSANNLEMIAKALRKLRQGV